MNAKVSVTTSSSNLLGAGQRRYLYIENLSDTDIRIRLDQPDTEAVTLAAGATPGILLKANGGAVTFTTEMSNDPAMNGAIRAIHGGSGTKDLNIVYW